MGRVARGLTGGSPVSARRAKCSAEAGESNEGLGASWGGRERLPDGAPAGGDSGDQFGGYGGNWDVGLVEEYQREEEKVLVCRNE